MSEKRDIKMLPWQNVIRKRPGMYIGDTNDGTGLHNTVFEVVDNAIAGGGKNITVVIHTDNSVSVQDDEVYFPMEDGLPVVEETMTQLRAGGRYPLLPVVNALAQKLELTLRFAGNIYRQVYEYGEPQALLLTSDDSGKNGTLLRFWPDLKIFTHFTEFKFDVLEKYLREMTLQNMGMSVLLRDQRNERQVYFVSDIATPLER